MPTLLLILTTIFFGLSFILTKSALQEIPPLSFIFFRFLCANIFLLPSIIHLRGKVKKEDIRRGAQLGVLLGGVIFLQTIGLQTITVSASAFLTGFAIVFVLAIRCVVQKQAPSFLALVATSTCMTGLGLVTQSQGLSWDPGVYYTLGCAFFLALYIYTLATYAGHSQALVLTLLQITVITLLAGLAALSLEGKIHIPTQANTWWATLGCGIICTALCSWARAYAQQHLSALQGAMISTLEPVSATMFAWLFSGEVLSFSFYIGAAMILGAIGLINWLLQGPEA